MVLLWGPTGWRFLMRGTLVEPLARPGFLVEAQRLPTAGLPYRGASLIRKRPTLGLYSISA